MSIFNKVIAVVLPWEYKHFWHGIASVINSNYNGHSLHMLLHQLAATCPLPQQLYLASWSKVVSGVPQGSVLETYAFHFIY